jgi:predicted MFS family arabinose efflux permease
VSSRDFVLLALAAFAAQLGYGVILPLLPDLVERIGTDTSFAAQVRHTGGLTTVYMLAAFAAAVPCARLAHRAGARTVLLIGLAAHSVALAALLGATDAVTAYILRAVAGMAASAVLAAVAVTIAHEPDRSRRARYFAGSSAAALLGLLAGPALSGTVSAAMTGMVHADGANVMTLAIPYLAASGVGVCVFLAIALWLPHRARTATVLAPSASWASVLSGKGTRAVLVANFLVLFGLAATEVILPLASRRALGLNAFNVSLLFALCSAVMIAVQAWLFATTLLERHTGGGRAAAGFLAMAIGFVWLDFATGLTSALAAVAVFAAGAGYLMPALAYAASLDSTAPAAEALGSMTAGASLGQAAGSAAGGLLYAHFGGAALWILSATMLAGGACARVARVGAPPAAPDFRASAGKPSRGGQP